MSRPVLARGLAHGSPQRLHSLNYKASAWRGCSTRRITRLLCSERRRRNRLTRFIRRLHDPDRVRPWAASPVLEGLAPQNLDRLGLEAWAALRARQDAKADR